MNCLSWSLSALRSLQIRSNTGFSSVGVISTFLGALICLVPIISSGSCPLEVHDDFESALVNERWLMVRDFAVVNFTLTIPSMINTITDLVYDFIHDHGTDSSNTMHHIVGFSTTETFMFLLGIEISSLIVFILPRSAWMSSTAGSCWEQHTMFSLISSLCSSFVLSGCALLLCLNRLCGRSATSKFPVWTMRQSIVIMSALILGGTVYSLGSHKLLVKYSTLTPGNPTFIICALTWLGALLLFSLHTFTWLRKVLKPALRGPGPGGRKSDRSRDQIYMPVVLIFMFIIQAIMMNILVFEWTFVPSIAASRQPSTGFSLLSHYTISILMTTLIVTLEMRLKSREITKGLVSSSSRSIQ